MTLFAFRRAKSREWTFCESIKFWEKAVFPALGLRHLTPVFEKYRFGFGHGMLDSHESWLILRFEI